jgi:hypothetical protein
MTEPFHAHAAIQLSHWTKHHLFELYKQFSATRLQAPPAVMIEVNLRL